MRWFAKVATGQGLALVILLLLSIPAAPGMNTWEDTPGKGYASCNKGLIGSYDQAIDKAKLDQFYYTAMQYVHGSCRQADLAAGVEMLIEAAELGHGKSALAVGNLYYVGEVLPEDAPKAQRYFSIAAVQGLVVAQHRLGLMLVTNADSPDDRSMGMYWLGVAATQGDGLSAFVLGTLHQKGMYGVKRDPCLAQTWFQAAEEMGFKSIEVANAETKDSEPLTCK